MIPTPHRCVPGSTPRTRHKRYQFFSAVYRRQKAAALLLAHHLDDQAETVLMRMCQGTGMRGLLGIRPQMNMLGMHVIRPLLSFSKKEIVDFLQREHFEFRHDESNQSKDFLRNRIRLEVLPFLGKKVNPRVQHALARIPEILSDEQDWLENEVSRHFNKVIASKARYQIIFRAPFFYKLHPAIQFRLLDKAIKQLDPQVGLLYENWLNIKPYLAKGSTAVQNLNLARSVRLKLETRFITLFKTSS